MKPKISKQRRRATCDKRGQIDLLPYLTTSNSIHYELLHFFFFPPLPCFPASSSLPIASRVHTRHLLHLSPSLAGVADQTIHLTPPTHRHEILFVRWAHPPCGGPRDRKWLRSVPVLVAQCAAAVTNRRHADAVWRWW